MGEVLVHPRVTERHPELSDEDVIEAWSNYVRMTRRDGDGNHWIAIGFDSSARAVEMIARESGGDFLIYHAMTPPTKSILDEMGLTRR